MSGQRLVIRRVVGHVEDDSFFASRRNHALHGASQFQRFVAAAPLLCRIYDGAGNFYALRRKKLLRFAATVSTAAMIHPFDFCGHILSFFLGKRRFRRWEKLADARLGAAAQRRGARSRRLSGCLRLRFRLRCCEFRLFGQRRLQR
jgi:hypothetical protein